MSGTEVAAATAVACVPDMISNILERVPDLVSLFRCSLVCKEWRGIVADPAFLRRRGIWPEPEGGQSQPQSSSLIGIFVQRDRLRDDFPTRAPPVLVPAPGSALGPQRRFLTSFVRDAGADGILDDANLLAARDGLLLLTAADHGAAGLHADGYSTLFQVLLVGRGRGHAGGHPHVCRFSSSLGDWDALDCSQTIFGARQPELWGPYGCCVAAVAHGGTVHWLFCGGDGQRFYTLDVSTGTGQVCMTALPVDAVAAITRAAGLHRDWWLCTIAEGRLALLCVKDNNRMVIMKQRDDGVRWDNSGHVAQVDVDMEVELEFGDESLSLVCIGERSGTALALYHSDPECAYVLDLASGSATKVEGWIRSFDYMTAVPCEINWEMFFVSRLGVKL